MKKTYLFISIFLMFASFVRAEYFIAIAGGGNVNNAIVSTGGGNNYYNKSLKELTSDKTYKGDVALHAFLNLLQDYKQKKFDSRIDAFKLINESTDLSDIKFKVSIFDGNAAIIFMDVADKATFSPMEIVDGKWIISGAMMQNSNIMSIFTLMLNYGRQISPEQFSSYKNYLSGLNTNIELPVVVKITKKDSKLPAYVLMTYYAKGKLYDDISSLFSRFLSAYENKDDEFISFWGAEESANIEKMNLSENRMLTLENPEITKLNKCKGGYEILGVSNFGALIVLFAITENGEFFPFFLRNYTDGQYKFVASSIFGGCSIYAISFFSSAEFREGFMLSTTFAKNKNNLLQQANGIFDVNKK